MMILERGRFLTEWVLLIAGLMLVGFVIGVAQYREYADIDRRERDRLATQAGIINKNLGRSLQVVDRALTGIRDDLLVRRREKDGMAQTNRRLRAFSEAMRTVLALAVLDARGHVVAAVTGAAGKKLVVVIAHGAKPALDPALAVRVARQRGDHFSA